MKTYIGALLLGTFIASGCSDDPKRRRHHDDDGEAGETSTSGSGGSSAGSAPRAGTSGASNPGDGGTNGIPSAGGSGNVGQGGTGNLGATGPGDAGEANGAGPNGQGGTSSPSGGTSSAEGGTGASTPGGTGGTGASGGSSGTSPNGGTGNTDPCGCTSTEACDQNETCVERVAIDDFGACDADIPEIEGRSGTWGDFAGTVIAYDSGVGDPGSAFVDRTCGAWMVGGTEESTTSEYAGIFVLLNADGTENGGPYSITGYTGIHVVIESEHQLVLQVRTVGDGYFGIVLTPDTLGTTYPVTYYDIPLSYLTALNHSELPDPGNFTEATQIQLTVVPEALDDFAFAVHYLGFY